MRETRYDAPLPLQGESKEETAKRKMRGEYAKPMWAIEAERRRETEGPAESRKKRQVQNA